MGQNSHQRVGRKAVTTVQKFVSAETLAAKVGLFGTRSWQPRCFLVDL